MLDGYASGVVDPIEQQRVVKFRQKLVNRPARTVPVPVVVDDQDATGTQTWIQVRELMLRGLVPIGVEPKQRDPIRNGLRNGFLDRSRDDVDPILRVSARCDERTHAVEVERVGSEGI